MLIGALFPSVEEYAASTLPRLVSPDIESHSGNMFNPYGEPIQASQSLSQGPTLQQVIEQSEDFRQHGRWDDATNRLAEKVNGQTGMGAWGLARAGSPASQFKNQGTLRIAASGA